MSVLWTFLWACTVKLPVCSSPFVFTHPLPTVCTFPYTVFVFFSFSFMINKPEPELITGAAVLCVEVKPNHDSHLEALHQCAYF